VSALDGVRRLLVIRHRAGGDLLLTTPALRALRAALPGAAIEMLASRGLGGMLEGNTDVDRVIEFDRRSLPSQAALYARLLRGGYDCVLDLVSNPRSAWMTALTRARIRVGYDLPGRSYAYTRALPREAAGPAGPILKYAPETALDLIATLGVPARGLALRFEVGAGAQSAIDRWLDAERVDRDRPVALCLPTGSWPAKTWLPERFAAVMDDLAADATPIWLWGPGERAAAESCRSRMRAPSLLAPETGWQELGALIRRSALWIGNDSGPKHVAVALGVPTVTVFGPTNPKTWHPPEGPHVIVEADGLECLHCNANACPLPGDRHMRCMRDIGPGRVIEAARTLLRRTPDKATCASL
jgi:ADP-heptose:LPS heptosyltransferase